LSQTHTEKKRLGQWLLDEGLIDTEQLRTALEEQRRSGLYLRDVFDRLGIVDEQHIIRFFEQELMIPAVKLGDYDVDDEIIQLVPEKIARRYRAIPLFRIRDSLTVAMEDPLNVLGIDEIAAETGLDIEPCVATRKGITASLRRYYGSESHLEVFDRDLTDEAIAGMEIDRQVIDFVSTMVRQAVEDNASDIHIEPDAGAMRVRYRVDGVLREVAKQPLAVHPAIVSRIKVLSDLDIAERRLPQDGRFHMELDDRAIDLRVSTFPTVHGENVVLRVLDKKNAILALSALGFDPGEHETIERLIHKPAGMILVTGPTGSGKTTTLYAVLQTINTPNRNIQTLEDPVEYILPLVRQTQVNEEIGLTFARGLRALVRQDPDVILVGEIRDRESAEIGVRSSLTGHLVLSTLHTNDAAGAIARLVDMEVDRFLIASSLLGVVAQRLVRRICNNCRRPVDVPEAVLNGLNVRLRGDETWYEGAGCLQCNDTGYRGRVAAYEILELNRALRTAILDEESPEQIRDIARKAGARSLREAAVAKAASGLTSIEEVLRVTKLDDDAAVETSSSIGRDGKDVLEPAGETRE